jgi:hypothetical protein
LTDTNLRALTIIALGGTQDGSLQGVKNQIKHLDDLIGQLEYKRDELALQQRILWAKETQQKRLQPSNPHYMAHMTHCYGQDHDWDYVRGSKNFPSYHSCKYGEDDICPAAMYHDPMSEVRDKL